MSKRNSRYNVYKHIRMALKLAPARQELLLRVVLAARVEADEATGEIFGRDGKTPREVLAGTANIKHPSSMDVAIAAMRKELLFKAHRVYSHGERAGGDRMILDWDRFDEFTEKLVLNADQDLAPSSAGSTPAEPSSARSKRPSLTGSKPPSSTGSNRDKDNGYSNGEVNGDSQGDIGALAQDPSPPADQASTPLASQDMVPAELHEQHPSGCELDGSIPWVAKGSKADQAPSSYRQAVYFDRTRAKLCLVNDERGRALYQALREDYPIEVIQRGLVAATVKAPTTAARNGGLEALVRTYCGYELTRGQAPAGMRGTGQFKPYKGGAFVP